MYHGAEDRLEAYMALSFQSRPWSNQTSWGGFLGAQRVCENPGADICKTRPVYGSLFIYI